MSEKDPATSQEIALALHEISRQTDFLRDQGPEAFLGLGVDSQILQLAACQMIIRLYAVLEDAPSDSLSGLPVREIRGMRNRLAHGYSDVDVALLWRTVDVALPALLSEVRRRLA